MRINYIPSIGILVFFGLYFYASTLYPGGSQADFNSLGYDWFHNYWCDLTSTVAKNQVINPARNIAISGMLVLSGSLLLLFYQFGIHLIKNSRFKKLFTISAFLSMISASVIFTKYHDSMTIIASLLGLVVVITILYYVRKSKTLWLQLSALACIILLLINNVIYYTSIGIYYLPFVQKLSFVFVLFWLIGLNYYVQKNA